MRVSKLVMKSMTSQGCLHDNVWPVESGCNSLATKIVAKVSRSLVLPKKGSFSKVFKWRKKSRTNAYLCMRYSLIISL